MPKVKTHKGLLKRIRVTKSGKVRFKPPRGRHLKSNKPGAKVRSYRKARFARSGDKKMLEALLHRPLRSQEQHLADLQASVEVQTEATSESSKTKS